MKHSKQQAQQAKKPAITNPQKPTGDRNLGGKKEDLRNRDTRQQQHGGSNLGGTGFNPQTPNQQKPWERSK